MPRLERAESIPPRTYPPQPSHTAYILTASSESAIFLGQRENQAGFKR